MTTQYNFEVPELRKRFVKVRLVTEGFPSKTKTSVRAKQAAVETLVKKGMDRALAEKSVTAREKLFPGGELDELHSPKDALIYWLGGNVISWLGHGEKVCSVHRIEAIEAKFAETQLRVLEVWSNLMRNYDNILANLAKHMGAAFDPSMYKTKAELEGRFKMELIFEPLPNPDAYSDFLGGLTPTQAEKLQQQLSEQVERAAKDATREYAEDMHQLLKGMSVSLAGGKVDGKFTRFSKSNLDRLRNMVESRLNLTGCAELDDALDAAAKAVEATSEAAKVRNNTRKNSYDEYLQGHAARECAAAASKLAGLL